MSYTPTDPARPWIVDENGYRQCHSCAGRGSTWVEDRRTGDPVERSGSCALCQGTGQRYVPRSQRGSSMVR